MNVRSEVIPDRGLPSSRALMAADAVALVAFVLTGTASHHDAGFLTVLARNLVPLGAAWVLVALAVGTYRRRSWTALLVTWLVAVPAGILARSWIVGSPRGSELVTFLLVGSGFTLLYLVVGRGVISVGTRTRAQGPPA